MIKFFTRWFKRKTPREYTIELDNRYRVRYEPEFGTDNFSRYWLERISDNGKWVKQVSVCARHYTSKDSMIEDLKKTYYQAQPFYGEL